MKKQILSFIGIVVLILLVWGGSWAWKNFKGAGPAFRKPNADITKQIPLSNDPDLLEAINNTDFPLTLPKGFAGG